MLEDGSMGEMPAAMRPIFPILSNKVSEMNMLIDQMLETARLEDSSLHLNLAPVDLGDALDDAIRTVRPFASNRHRLVVDRGNGELPVNADATRLNTILVNLIGNAIKYSPAGGEVRCRIVADDSRASVEISDQGLGINESDLPRLFTRFGRIVTPENSHIQGTGLGLYLARELARMHGGDITVESTPGAGSTFRLCLPLATSAKA
jgi:signal transduction histidine kinase